MIASPRATTRAIANGAGDAREIVAWCAVVAFSAAPVRTGQALLLMRVEPLAGALDLLRTVADRFLPAMIGCFIASAVASLVERTRAETSRVSFDRLLDVMAFLLVPHLLLSSAGVLATRLGIELWFLPHRAPTGSGGMVAIRVAVAYVWPVALFAMFLKERLSVPLEPT